jgi:hypothetical protein
MKKITPILLLMFLFIDASYAQEPKLTFWENLVFEVFPSRNVRNQKKNARLLFDGDSEKLKKFILEVENENEAGGQSRDRRDALRESPFMLYFLLGLYYECEGNNPEKSALYFSVANEWVTKYNDLSDAEVFLAKKFIKNQRKHDKTCLKGSYQFAGPKQIKQLAADRAKKYLEDKDYVEVDKRTAAIQTKIKSINEFIATLKAEKLILEIEIDSLRKVIDSKQVEIQGLTQKNHQAALNDLKKFERNGTSKANNVNVVENLSGGAKLVYRDGVSTDVIGTKVENTGVVLGDYCSGQIKESTKNIVESLMKFIDFEITEQKLPASHKDKVVVKISLAGKSDGHKVVVGANGICALKYKESETVTAEYFSMNDKRSKKITLKQGDAICDEELALLRAVCADQQIRNYFRGKIKNENIITEYTAKVHNEKGDAYRGVDININIENLFNYNVLQIEEKRRRQEEIDAEIKEKEAERTNLEIDMEKINSGFGLYRKRIDEQIQDIKNEQKR